MLKPAVCHRIDGFFSTRSIKSTNILRYVANQDTVDRFFEISPSTLSHLTDKLSTKTSSSVTRKFSKARFLVNSLNILKLLAR